MTRTGLLIALAIAAGVGLVFAIFPQLDIEIARFMLGKSHPVNDAMPRWTEILREVARWTVALVAAPAAVAVIVKLVLPRRRMLITSRATVLMITTLLVGPWLTTNVILKDYWGRPRPAELKQFGGSENFIPWWDPRGPCRNNCSFVAGEPSGAFWTIAAASYAPPQWRALAYGAAIAFGTGVGLLRMSVGGHFFTDVVFAGIFTFLIIWFAHALLYRWRTRVSDAALEQAIGSVTLPIYDAVTRLFGKRRLR